MERAPSAMAGFGPMTPVSIPLNEMTAFDLPKVCVATGSRDNVIFKPVKFQWYPRWIAVFAIAPIIMIIVMLVMMRRAKGELPFTEAAWKQWQTNKRVGGVGSIAAIVFFFGGIATLGSTSPGQDPPFLFAFLLFVAGIAALAVAVRVARKGGPMAVKIDDKFIVLNLPDAGAAAAISEHLVGGAQRRTAGAQLSV